MSGFDDFQTERRRLLILRELTESSAYTAEENALRQRLEALGHAVSRDRLRSDLAWLAEQDLIILQTPGGVHVPSLAARGMDAARGLTVVPGVAKPLPGE
jgi:hypothetical protein